MSIRLDGTSLRDVRSPTGYCRSHQFGDTVAFCSSFPKLLRNNGRNEAVNNMENQAGIRGKGEERKEASSIPNTIPVNRDTLK